MSIDSSGLTSGADSRWVRVREIFDLAADHPAAEWPEIVARESAGDDALHDEVLRLLAALDADHLDLDHPRFELGPPEEGAERLGAVIAPYRLVRVVGHDGMGTVYEGVRADGAYEQRVAIKFIRPILGAEVMAARFRRERQILAALEHRNIARLLDGGATERGEPYFVMEYVDGEPITAWAAARRLTIGDRLRLFLQACAAVEHAHGKFVVHRDIKPANILVTADGSVKLLDFGVAKLLGAQDGDELTTVTHQRPFTPEYASPEQLRDEPASAASDLYSLGIVLYELLSGRRPYEVPSRSPLAVLRAVEVDAPRPSAAATAEAADATGETTLPKLRHLLAGELDNVVRKAIRADVETRYRSVEQLSDDIRRYLDGRPVSAQPDSLAYRARKFVRRNRAGVIAATVTLVALVTAIIMAALRARDAAAEQGRQLALATAASLNELGAARFAAGKLRAADANLSASRALCNSAPPGPVPLVCLDGARALGLVKLWEGDAATADTLLRRSLLHARTTAEPVPLTVAQLLSQLAQVRQAAGDFAGADTLYREAAAQFASGGGGRSGERVEQLGWLAVLDEAEGKVRSADSVVRLQMPLVAGFDGSTVLIHLAWIHAQEGNLAAAKSELVEGRAGSTMARDSTALLFVRLVMMEGLVDIATGAVDRGVAELRQMLPVAQSRYRREDPRLAEVQDALGRGLVAQGHRDEAVALLEASHATFLKRFGPDNPVTGAVATRLAAATAGGSHAGIRPP